MPLDDKIKRFTGVIYRHIPSSPDENPKEYKYCGITEGRWNIGGEPTLYTGKSDVVCVCEYGRNMDKLGVSRDNALDRSIYKLSVELEFVLDLTDIVVLNNLGIDNIDAFKIQEKCRATAKHLRTSTKTQAIIVPSLALMDDLSKWCLVVFLEKVDTGENGFVKDCRFHRRFKISEVG